MGLFRGFFEDDRRSMTWKGILLIFPFVLFFLCLFGGTYLYAMQTKRIWLILIDAIAITLNYILLETIFMKNACEDRLDVWQEEIRRGNFPAVVYEADVWSCIIIIGYLVLFCYDYYKEYGFIGPIGIYAGGVLLPVIYVILILRNARELKTKLVSIFRVLVLDIIIDTCCIMHICIIINWMKLL